MSRRRIVVTRFIADRTYRPIERLENLGNSAATDFRHLHAQQHTDSQPEPQVITLAPQYHFHGESPTHTDLEWSNRQLGFLIARRGTGVRVMPHLSSGQPWVCVITREFIGEQQHDNEVREMRDGRRVSTLESLQRSVV